MARLRLMDQCVILVQSILESQSNVCYAEHPLFPSQTGIFLMEQYSLFAAPAITKHSQFVINAANSARHIPTMKTLIRFAKYVQLKVKGIVFSAANHFRPVKEEYVVSAHMKIRFKEKRDMEAERYRLIWLIYIFDLQNG